MKTTIISANEVELTFSSRAEYLETDDLDIAETIEAALPVSGSIGWAEEPLFCADGRATLAGWKR